jgi:hypothetical protein
MLPLCTAAGLRACDLPVGGALNSTDHGTGPAAAKHRSLPASATEVPPLQSPLRDIGLNFVISLFWLHTVVLMRGYERSVIGNGSMIRWKSAHSALIAGNSMI